MLHTITCPKCGSDKTHPHIWSVMPAGAARGNLSVCATGPYYMPDAPDPEQLRIRLQMACPACRTHFGWMLALVDGRSIIGPTVEEDIPELKDDDKFWADSIWTPRQRTPKAKGISTGGWVGCW